MLVDDHISGKINFQASHAKMPLKLAANIQVSQGSVAAHLRAGQTESL